MSFKIIIIGDSCVGKTSLLKRYVNNTFLESYKATIGVDFLTKNIKINKKIISLQLWDTAGNERFHTLSNAFYRGADACIIVFDLTNIISFKNLENWMDEFLLYSNVSDPNNYPFIIVGNKSDLINDTNRVISEKYIQKFCQNKNVKYFEVSTKLNTNINNVFIYLINRLHNKNNSETNIDLYDMESINFNENHNEDNNDMNNNYDKIQLNKNVNNGYNYCFC
jgi:Ras-related protein Rab-7A